MGSYEADKLCDACRKLAESIKGGDGGREGGCEGGEGGRGGGREVAGGGCEDKIWSHIIGMLFVC